MCGPSVGCQKPELKPIIRRTPENRRTTGPWGWKARGFILVLSLDGLLLSAIANVPSLGARTQSLQSVSRVPVTVLDEVDHLRAPSWKTIPLSLPYSGSLSINVHVVRGNPIDVLLISPDQLKRVKQGEWNKVRAVGKMRANHTKSYQQESVVLRGEYYLVVGDRYLGEPPSPPSEIELKVRLNVNAQ